MTIVKELKRRQRAIASLMQQEYAEVTDELHMKRRTYSDQQLQGYEAWNASRGDASRFHESSPVGRLAFAQESGIFCNLDV